MVSAQFWFCYGIRLRAWDGKDRKFRWPSFGERHCEDTGDFSWTYWTAVFMNLFSNAASLVFWLFTNYSMKRLGETRDPATGEKLTEKNKKFEISKMLRLPWTFWGIIGFTAFQTSLASVFSANATELSHQRFDVD